MFKYLQNPIAINEQILYNNNFPHVETVYTPLQTPFLPFPLNLLLPYHDPNLKWRNKESDIMYVLLVATVELKY